MALGLRHIQKVPIEKAIYERHPKNIVDMIGAHKMVGLLKQIGELSEFAADVFGSLFKEATGTVGRISQLSERVTMLERQAPDIENVFANVPASTFYKAAGGKAWRRSDMVSGSLLSPVTQPLSIQAVRASVQAPPRVAQLDALSGKDCLRTYSDPQFFLEQWLRAEEERQKVLMDATRARQAEKKKNKKKKVSKEKKAVAAVAIKQYNQFGELIHVEAAAPTAKQSTAADDDAPDDDDDADAKAIQAAIAAAPKGAPAAAPQYKQAAPQPAAYQPYNAHDRPAAPPGGPSPYAAPAAYAAPYAAPPAPPMGGGYAAPPPAPALSSPYDAPPMETSSAPEAPPFDAPPFEAPPFDAPPFEAPPFDAPPLDDAPPMDDTAAAAPRATPVPRAMPPPRGGGLLDQIQGGVKLKSASAAAAAAPRPADSRGGLLGEIRNRNFALKKVEERKVVEEEKPKAAAAGGAMGSIMDILARRNAIKGSDDDDASGGDDWD